MAAQRAHFSFSLLIICFLVVLADRPDNNDNFQLARPQKTKRPSSVLPGHGNGGSNESASPPDNVLPPSDNVDSQNNIPLDLSTDALPHMSAGGNRNPSSFPRQPHRRPNWRRCTRHQSIRCAPWTVIIIGSMVGFLLLALITWALIFFWLFSRKGKPKYSNHQYLMAKQDYSERNRLLSSIPPIPDDSPFQSGTWQSRHYRQGWNGPYEFPLVFNSRDLKVEGTGVDEIGDFTLSGMYSLETKRMAMMKYYRFKKDDGQIENYGHTVNIQLEWNAREQAFVGTWYIRTPKYRGQDKFELRLVKPSAAYSDPYEAPPRPSGYEALP